MNKELEELKSRINEIERKIEKNERTLSDYLEKHDSFHWDIQRLFADIGSRLLKLEGYQ